jgi:2-iminobutanoate/2-iminopropanoate deaminase
MKPIALFSPDAPQPIGPYSQAIAVGNLLFLSGQIPLDSKTGSMTGETVEEQTRQIFKNIRAVLSSQSLDVSALVKTTVFLTNMDSFANFNKIYEEEMNGWKPARSVVEVSKLPKAALVEIEAVACR